MARLLPAVVMAVASSASAAAPAVAAPLSLVSVGTLRTADLRHRRARRPEPALRGRASRHDQGARGRGVAALRRPDRALVSSTDGERGLLSVAFAPDFATSRRLYAYFTARPPLVPTAGDIAIVRLVAAGPDGPPGAPELLLSIPHGAAGNHNGGQLQFGPDGLLYAGTGDGGAGNDPAANGQNLDSANPPNVGGVDHHPLLGKLLRLDVSPAAGYAVPAGNAFGPATKRAGDLRASACATRTGSPSIARTRRPADRRRRPERTRGGRPAARGQARGHELRLGGLGGDPGGLGRPERAAASPSRCSSTATARAPSARPRAAR